MNDLKRESVKYDRLKKLGEGCVATVYEGRYGDRKCAVKEFKNNCLSDEEKAGLNEEIRALRNLINTPFIVEYLGSIVGSPPYVLVMELMKSNLNDLIYKNPLPMWLPANLRTLDDKLSILSVIAMVKDATLGLKILHSRGHIHRDIKPANILIDARGFCKLGDLGLAKSVNLFNSICVSVHGTQMQARGGAKGTTAYLAPELLSLTSNIAYSPQSDVHAMVVTLNEALSRETPFNNYSDLMVCVEAIRAGEKPDMKLRAVCETSRPALPRAAEVCDALEKMITDTWREECAGDRMTSDELCVSVRLNLEIEDESQC